MPASDAFHETAGASMLGALGGDVEFETKVEYVLNLTHRRFSATLKHVKKSVIAMDVKL